LILIAAGVLALVVVLGLLMSSMFTPGSLVRNFVEGLSGNAGPIQKDYLRMRILLVVTRREDGEIIVLARIQVTDTSSRFRVVV
jgi:hypothetical protein